MTRLLLATRLEDSAARLEPRPRLRWLDTSDRRAIDEVSVGRAALAIVATDLSAGERRRGLRQHALAVHVPVLAVHPDNSLRTVAIGQVRDLLTLRVSRWQALGGDDVPIEVVVPRRDALLDLAERLLIRGDSVAARVRTVDDEATVLAFVAHDRSRVGLVGLRSLMASDRGLRALAIDTERPEHAARGHGGYPAQTLHLIEARPRGSAAALRDVLLGVHDVAAVPPPEAAAIPAAPR